MTKKLVKDKITAEKEELFKALILRPDDSLSVPMGVDHTGVLVDRLSSESLDYAYDREAVENAFQAGATEVWIGFDGFHAEIGMGLKWMCADNGKGMTRQELEKHFSTLASSGKEMGAHANFGMGIRTSLLKQNPLGVLVISGRNGEFYMIKLGLRHDGRYGLVRLPYMEDPEEDGTGVVQYLESVPARKEILRNYSKLIKNNGTVVIALGREENESTYMSRDKSHIGSAPCGVREHEKVLNRRYFEIPKGKVLRVAEVTSPNPAKWPKMMWPDTKTWQWRYIKGTKHYLEECKKDKGTVTLNDGTEVTWVYLKAMDKGVESPTDKGRDIYHAYWDPKSFVGILYDNEVYNIGYFGKAQRQYHRFGVTPWTVIQNLTLLIRPPKSGTSKKGVEPNASRSKLIWTGEAAPEKVRINGAVEDLAERELPMERWGAEFTQKMPKALQRIINEAMASEDRDLNEVLSKRLAPWLARLYMPRFKRTDDGSKEAVTYSPIENKYTGEGANSGTDSDGSKIPDNGAVIKGEKVKGKTVKSKNHIALPTFEWCTPGADLPDNLSDKVGQYIREQNLLQMNRTFLPYTQTLEFYAGKYVKSPTSEKVIRENVQLAFVEHLSMKIVHTLMFEGRPQWGKKEMEAVLSPEALSMAATGWEWTADLGRALGRLLNPKDVLPAASDSEDTGGEAVLKVVGNK